jgi:hypothetical protein
MHPAGGIVDTIISTGQGIPGVEYNLFNTLEYFSTNEKVKLD